jgi:hypothetical protein
MNRRSFLKTLGIGGGALATFSLSSVGLSAIRKYSDKADVAAAQEVMNDIEDYGSSDLVSRVPTSQLEKAILLGITHNSKKQLAMLRIDESLGDIQGRAYHDCVGLGFERRYLPVTFRFNCDYRAASSDFDYLMRVTQDVARQIMSYKEHLIADPALAKLMSRQAGLIILPVF